MASFKFDGRAKTARFFFRFGGRQHNKTVPVADAREASRIVGRIEDALRDVDLGRLELPEGAEVVAFFLSGGKVSNSRVSRPIACTVGDLIAAYEADPPPHLEPSTVKMQAIHGRRILEIVKPSTPLEDFDGQEYASRRSRAKYRGEPIHRDTVAKELKTFRQAWAWVASRSKGMQPPNFDLAGVKLPKAPPARPFMTRAEIELELSRGESLELWDTLWLDRGQVKALLEHVQARSKSPLVPAMFAAVAYTGMRRSELCRSRLADWRLEDGVVRIRQKKRDLELEYTIREVPLHPGLAAAFRGWLEHHPGGRAAFCLEGCREINWDAARHRFVAALADSEWAVVRGWHVLRHSFASNLASSGVDQRLIDKWMGHSTSIRLRYQHLRPQDERDAIALL